MRYSSPLSPSALTEVGLPKIPITSSFDMPRDNFSNSDALISPDQLRPQPEGSSPKRGSSSLYTLGESTRVAIAPADQLRSTPPRQCPPENRRSYIWNHETPRFEWRRRA